MQKSSLLKVMKRFYFPRFHEKLDCEVELSYILHIKKNVSKIQTAKNLCRKYIKNASIIQTNKHVILWLPVQYHNKKSQLSIVSTPWFNN